MRKLSIGRLQLPAAAVLAIALCSWPMASPAADFSKYHTYAELTTTLQSLVKDHADIAKLVEIGKTRENRSIWAVEIMNAAGSASPTRPALLVAANFEGDHLVGSELAVYIIDYLLSNYATSPQVKQQIDTHAFYIIPRMNPDAAEFFFAPVKADRKTNTSPLDDDNDGRVDENPPEDLNKDGYITLMRVKDPKGPYMIHPDDPRLLKRADPQRGEVGAYRLYYEGIDRDNDGFIAEDGPGGADLNRNFMHKYPYYQTDAGRFMASELETRALMEYIGHHRNIAAMLTFGESDNLIAGRNGDNAPPQTIDLFNFAQQGIAEARRVGMFQAGGGGRGFGMGGRGGGGIDQVVTGARGAAGAAPAAGGRGGGQGGQRPAETINPGDAEYMQTIVDKYRELTGLRSDPPVRTPAGAFFEVGYYQFGVPSFCTPGWGLPQASAPGARGGAAPDVAMGGGGGRGMAAGGRGAGGGAAASDGSAAFDLRLLRWMDAEKIDGFINWTPYKHPTLGDVDIGGFKPYATTNPPAAKIAELGKTHAEFALYLASLFPKIAVADFSATSLGGGLFRIQAEIENKGFLPTSTAHGQVSRSVRATMVQLSVDAKDIISGAPKTNNVPVLAGSGRRQSYQWIVRGRPGTTVTLKVVAQKGGTDTATITLK
ncbi:MAG: hypothetical protein LAP85_03050 [Acidobacteriia bacterium]|nr:hypothetical protein [Terriglobia bacterium]